MVDHPVPSGLSARASAVRAHKQRVIISSRTFGRTGMRARIVVGDASYDVTARELARLEAGETPDEVQIEPVPEA